MSEDTNLKNETDSEDEILSVSFPEFDEYELDTLIEEVNVLDLEGHLFAFDPLNRGLKTGLHEHKLGERGGVRRTLKLDFHPTWGQPSSLAYRVLQAIFKKITDEYSPKGFPDRVSFSQREMGRLVGLSTGGPRLKDLYRAFQQLSATRITAHLFEKDSKNYVESTFHLFPRVSFAGNENRLLACSVVIDGEIVASLNRNYWVKFNWADLQSLSPIGMVLYKRLYRYFAGQYSQSLKRLKRENAFTNTNQTLARQRITFEKSYDDICNDWLGGLKVWRYKSEVKRVLDPHMNQLRALGLIRSWKVDNMKGEKSFKLSFNPGMGFFRDYELFWLTQHQQPSLPFQSAADKIDYNDPFRLLEEFHKALYGSGDFDRTIFPRTQLLFAQELIRKFGLDSSIDLIKFAIEQAKRTQFDIKTINGIKQYIPGWKASQEARQRNRELDATRREKVRQERLRDAYDAYQAKVLESYRETLSETQIADLEAEAERQIRAESKTDIPSNMIRMGIRIRLDAMLLARTKYASFEEWLSQQQ